MLLMIYMLKLGPSFIYFKPEAMTIHSHGKRETARAELARRGLRICTKKSQSGLQRSNADDARVVSRQHKVKSLPRRHGSRGGEG